MAQISFWNISALLLLFISSSFHVTPGAAVPVISSWSPTNQSNPFENTLSKRDTVTNCMGDAATLVKYMIVEARAMAQASVTRTQLVYNYLDQTTVPDPSTLPASTRAAFRTFETIFGKIYFGETSGFAASNVAGKARVSTILAKSTTMLQAITNIENIALELWCDDSWLTTTDYQGNTNSNQYFYFDSRTTGDNDWVNLSGLGGSCRDVSQRTGFATDRKGISVVTLCQGWMQNWANNYLAGNTLTNLASGSYTTLPVSLVKIGPGDFLSMNIFHEFSHCKNIFPDTVVNGASTLGIFVDSSCLTGDTAYGWNCIMNLGSTSPSEAIVNADSFSFYAAAMFLASKDWHTGFPVALPGP